MIAWVDPWRLLLPTRVLFWIGPAGWLALMAFNSLLFVLRDLKSSSPRLRSLNNIALCAGFISAAAMITCLVTVMFFQPGCRMTDTITPP